VRAGPARSGLVVGVEQFAGVDREAAAADAGREPAAKSLQRFDLAVELVAPASGEPFPVAARGRAAGRQRLDRGTDSLERDPGGAAGLDQRDAPQDRAFITALIAARATRGDQPLRLLEAQRRRRDAAARRHFTDRQLGRHLT